MGAIPVKAPHRTDLELHGWRELIPHGYTSHDIVGLFRLKVTNIIALLYTTN